MNRLAPWALPFVGLGRRSVVCRLNAVMNFETSNREELRRGSVLSPALSRLRTEGGLVVGGCCFIRIESQRKRGSDNDQLLGLRNTIRCERRDNHVTPHSIQFVIEVYWIVMLSIPMLTGLTSFHDNKRMRRTRATLKDSCDTPYMILAVRSQANAADLQVRFILKTLRLFFVRNGSRRLVLQIDFKFVRINDQFRQFCILLLKAIGFVDNAAQSYRLDRNAARRLRMTTQDGSLQAQTDKTKSRGGDRLASWSHDYGESPEGPEM